MENRKITADDARNWEIESLRDAIGNALELNDEFIARYCGARVAAQLRRVSESDRESLLAAHIGDGRDVGGLYSLSDSAIAIPIGEIEYQFDGAAADTFADVGEWTISGNLAYATLDAAEFPIDVDALERDIDECLSGDCPDEFVSAYLRCALWSSVDIDTGNPLDDKFHVDDIAPETRRAAEADCADFWARHGWILSRDVERGGFDFWLTRNGHGAGFWDGSWNFRDANYGPRLTAAAKVYGGVDLIPGDDGKIYG